MPEKDPWEGESGFTDAYIIDVKEARFITDVRYGDNLLLEWVGASYDLDTGEMLQPDRSERFSCGKGWSSVDGRIARHESGQTKGFQKSSIMQRVLDRAKEQGLGDTLRTRGQGPWDAGIWGGMRWRMGPELLHFGKDLEDKERIMPLEYLGGIDTPVQVGGGQAQAQAASAAPAPAAPAAPATPTVAAAQAAAPAAPTAATNGELTAQLKDLATSCETHQAFKEAAMRTFPAILEPVNETVLMQVVRADGIFAEAKA